jgi:glycine/D-amino acid oxidase-like deaminating enzyme/nitrite reductase/ring-hydroxylating ferredoxin subunit
MKDSRPASYWIESTEEPSYPALTGDLEVDVCVVGAGIVGVTAATLLKATGRKVALLDMGGVARGASGCTTAKITSGHNLIYQDLERVHGVSAARAYAQANEAGLAQIATFVERFGIDCDFERKANYVYCEESEDVDGIRREVDACGRAGLDVAFVTGTTLPFPIAGAIELADQAQFHPRKYLLALADRLRGGGSHVFQRTRAVGVHEGDPCVVDTPGSHVRAEHVVLATHYPFLDRGLFFPRVHPTRSYAIAGAIDDGSAPEGMFISSSEPIRSIRTIRDDARTLLMVGGEGHSVGQDHDTQARYSKLEAWARDRLGLTSVEYRWSTQDGVSVDGLPYVGPIRLGTTKVFTATAFAKWGLANGAVAAEIIADAITGRPNQWASLFNPNRITIRQSAQRFVAENAKVALHFLRDRVAHPQRGDLEQLSAGEAAIHRRGTRLIAVYRDDHGELHSVSAVCTHLGCVVAWNSADKSWDCPCHGSRFDVDGRVLEGPATGDLPHRDL